MSAKEELLKLADECRAWAFMLGTMEKDAGNKNVAIKMGTVSDQIRTIASAMPAEGGEAVAWMLQDATTDEIYWDSEACVFGDSSSAYDAAEQINDSEPQDRWEAIALYAHPPAAPSTRTGEGVVDCDTGTADFEVWQEDLCVAGCSGPVEDATREAQHYAMMYGQDGPVEVFRVHRTRVELPTRTGECECHVSDYCPIHFPGAPHE